MQKCKAQPNMVAKWLGGWLGGWVAGWPGGWVAGWLGGRVAEWPAGRVAGRLEPPPPPPHPLPPTDRNTPHVSSIAFPLWNPMPHQIISPFAPQV